MLYELNERLMNNNMGIVYEMDELDDVLEGRTASEIIRMTQEDFNINDPYFEFDGYGHLKSYSNLDELLELYNDVE